MSEPLKSMSKSRSRKRLYRQPMSDSQKAAWSKAKKEATRCPVGRAMKSARFKRSSR